MELKVWVEGIQRIVCGVTEATTCQDVVYALAHATGKTGRFTLIERWRNNERLLTPQEHPLKVVSKWGEYSSEVQLILQRSGGWNTTSPSKNMTQQSFPSPPSSQQEVNVHREMSVDENDANSKLHLKQQDNKNSAAHHHSLTNNNKEKDEVIYSARYRDLVRLVNFQRDKLATQQQEIAKYDAEINFWESKAREQKSQMELILQETQRYQSAITSNEIKLRGFGSIEEERDLILQQERTLKSELTLLRSKLANSETELLQCKNKIRLLGEELESEDRAREDVKEIDRLQRELEEARHTSEVTTQACRNITHQIDHLQTLMSEKKVVLEKLVADMKEANLQSLSISPAEEIKLLLEGSHKPGSTRRMIGSPRQLENAVPTSKNPHGVWV